MNDKYEFLDSDGEIDFDKVNKMRKERKKNIEPLEKLDHTQIKYNNFNKNFYDEHEEIKALTSE